MDGVRIQTEASEMEVLGLGVWTLNPCGRLRMGQAWLGNAGLLACIGRVQTLDSRGEGGRFSEPFSSPKEHNGAQSGA